MTRLLAGLALIVMVLTPVSAHAADGDELLSDALAMLGQLTDQFGNPYFTVIGASGITIEIAPLPPGIYGTYVSRPRRVLLSTQLLDEDATVLTAVIAHELQHARDVDLLAFGPIQN